MKDAGKNETESSSNQMMGEQSSSNFSATTHCNAPASDGIAVHEPNVESCRECNTVELCCKTDEFQTMILDLERERFGLYIFSVRNQTLLNSLAMNVDAFIK